MNKLKYAFFGSPEFAAIILKRVIEMGFPPEVVICNPDKPQGRKQILTPPPAKKVAEENGIKVWQPEKLTLEEFKKEVPGADFGIVAAYSKIIRDEVLKEMPHGVIGVHPSLLPYYRGATPIQSAILNGETKTGVTLYLMDKEVDHGPILSQIEAPIGPEDTFSTLIISLAGTSAELIQKTIGEWLNGGIKPQEQDHSKATLTKKFSRQDGFIEPEKITSPGLAHEINNRIRALNPEPGTWTYGNAFPDLNIPKEKTVKILDSEIINGNLRIKRIQIEGKTPRDI